MRQADKYAWRVIALAMMLSALALACLATPVKAQRSTTIATCGTLTQATPAIGSAGIMAYDQNGSQCVSASVTASVTGFAPAGTFATLSTSGVSASVALPAGAVVVFSNTGTTAVSCTLGIGSATASASQNVIQSGSWMALTVGSNTFGACIDQTGVVANTVVLSGGSGLPTGAGGGGSSGGGAVTIADAADASQGGIADAACATDNGSCTEIALVKRANQRLTTLNTTLGTPLQAGGNINNVAGTVSLPTGASTAANQTSVIGTKAAGTAATNSLLAGGVYNSGGVTLTDGQQAAAQLSAAGEVKVVGTGVAQGSTTSGQTGSLVMGAVTTGPPTYTTAQTSPVSLDTAGNTRVAATPYPSGSTPYTATATGTTGATTATLAGAASVTTYVCGFSIRANATAAATGNATVTGVITATLNFTQWTAPNASGLGITEMIFSPCIPASGTNQSVAVVSAAPGTGGVVSVTAWGYKL